MLKEVFPDLYSIYNNIFEDHRFKIKDFFKLINSFDTIGINHLNKKNESVIDLAYKIWKHNTDINMYIEFLVAYLDNNGKIESSFFDKKEGKK